MSRRLKSGSDSHSDTLCARRRLSRLWQSRRRQEPRDAPPAALDRLSRPLLLQLAPLELLDGLRPCPALRLLDPRPEPAARRHEPTHRRARAEAASRRRSAAQARRAAAAATSHSARDGQAPDRRRCRLAGDGRLARGQPCRPSPSDVHPLVFLAPTIAAPVSAFDGQPRYVPSQAASTPNTFTSYRRSSPDQGQLPAPPFLRVDRGAEGDARVESTAPRTARMGCWRDWRIVALPHRFCAHWQGAFSSSLAIPAAAEIDIASQITYKSGRVGEKTIQLRPYPVHICAATPAPPLFCSVPSHFSHSCASSTLGGRRNSDFALTLACHRSAAPGSAKSPAPSLSATTERRFSAANVPLLTHATTLSPPSRPPSGRRLSEQSDAVDAPARTRLRREAPASSSARSATIPSPLSGSSTSHISRSSTIDTLGPDTPTTAEFLASTAPPTHLSPKHSSGLPSTHVIRHVGRSPRPSIRARPRSSGSQRSSINDSARSTSNLSISSIASVKSFPSDQQSLTEYGGSSTAGGSPLVASADGMLGLTLGDATAESAAESPSFAVFDGAAAPTSPHSRPFQGAPSPPPSEPPSPVPHLAVADISAFRDPFADSSYAKQAKIASEPSVDTEMYISPRCASSLDSTSTRRASFSGAAGSGAFMPASPHSLSPPPSLQPPPSPHSKQPNVTLAVASDSADSSRRSSVQAGPGTQASSRKGSVGTLLTNLFGRRGSKAQ